MEEQQHMTEEDYCVYFQFIMGESNEDIPRELEYVVEMWSEEHNRLLVVYIPRAEFPEDFMHPSPTVMNIFFGTNCPHVEVRRSGIRIVYQEDFQGFVETIIRCMQREDTLELYDKWVVEDWIDLIGLQGGHLCTSNKLDSITRRARKFELLSQKYRNQDWTAPSLFFCVFYGTEISKWKWFMHFNEGNSAEIQLPPNLFDDANWLGIAQLVPKLKPSDFAIDLTFFVYIPRGGKYFKFWRQCNLARKRSLPSKGFLMEDLLASSNHKNWYGQIASNELVPIKLGMAGLVARNSSYQADNKTRTTIQVQRLQKVENWCLPSFGLVKLNTGGAFVAFSNHGGVGQVLQNERGEILAGFSYRKEFMVSAFQLVLLTIRHGLELLQAMQVLEGSCSH
ncbi:hypothetical protein ABKV19_014705 [Rosa sericea]